MGRGVVKPLAVEIFDRLDVPLEPEAVLRFLGYPQGAAARPAVIDRVRRAVEEAEGVLRPRGVYALYAVAGMTDATLSLGEGVEFAGEIGSFLRAAGRVAVFVTTVGSEITGAIESAWGSGDVLRGTSADAVGSFAADRSAEALAGRLSGNIGPGEALTPVYSPGYCGMDLGQQRLLFRLVDAGAVGVELLPSMLMRPIKSVSGLIGIGPKDEVEALGSPCARCPMMHCRMRR